MSGRRPALALVLVAAAIVGCGGADNRPPAQAAATSTPAPPPVPRETTVHFKAADGKPVTAEYAAAGKHAPAVVLLHEIRGGPDQWDELIAHLHAAGLATLAYASRSSVLERERVHDVVGAVRWLRARPDIDDRRLALVGASIGASTTVFAMATATRRTVDAAVALSPPDSADIWRLQDHGRYHPHDMLLMSDQRESGAVDGMLDGAIRSKGIRSTRPGHGVALLPQADVRDALLDWLAERLRR